MGLDNSKYIEKFSEESLENISIVETLLFEIKDPAVGGQPDRQDNLITLLRALHTLKGSARMLEFKHVEALSHEIESVFIALKENKISLSDKAVHLILASLDELKSSVTRIKAGAEDGADTSVFQKELSALSENKKFSVPETAVLINAIPESVSLSEEKLMPQTEPSGSAADVQPEPDLQSGDKKEGLKIDKSKYIPKFIDEALENISIVETLLFEIKNASSAGSSVADDLVTLMRALHTVKGAARMLEFNQIEAVSHALETVFLSLKEERITLNDKAVKLILAAIDELKRGIDKVKSGGKDDMQTEVFQKELSALGANEDFDIPSADEANKPQKPAKQEQDSKDAKGGAKRDKLEEAKAESIRISLERIDGIIHNMAALQSLEISARNIARDSETINESSRQFSHLLSAEKSWNSPLLQEYRAMELLISKMGSLVKNYAVDVGNNIRTAYDSIISLRMLPLSTALDAYPRHVFTIASELGKRAKIHIEGAENEIDKNLIESLSEVFLHMIRNSIDHGIEKPEER